MKAKNSAFIQILMEDLEVYILSDGSFGIGTPQPILAPEIEKEIVSDALKALYLSEDDYKLPISTLLIRKGNRNILVDTGEGYHNPKSAGWLQNSLTEIGIFPEDITDILITHAHRDHIGGILSREDERIYPNADYYISAQELNFWTSEEKDFSYSKMPADSYPNGLLQKKTLSVIKDRLNIFHPGDILFSCIQTQAAPGHTPGHIIFNIFSGKQSITHIVDVVHSPLLIRYPEWGTRWDVNFDQGIATRKQVLEDCYLNKTLVTTCHLPWPGIGYIDKIQDQWQWIPKAFSDPFRIKI
ncbi:MBL fold metallo-hydrolase [Chryseobacterium piperi]|uniref:MBL fold metallo-hydrolase n=1 Tax=Chryseobacterium piperi TaxID=558152 RepID=UPI00068D2903|nr:MBL fold metallo-hydrolase [Chryseobacterium piperi]ASW73617.1 MBL fold metallo-hydrolase [Chryseobacterium piperi]